MPLDPQQELIERYGDQLRAKISSKFSASTFLAGFAGTILSGLLSSLWPPAVDMPVHLPKVLALTVAGTILFIAAVIRLDELSMPKRFWPSSQDIQNPGGDVGLLTEQDLRVLKDRMVYYWRFLTLLGTATTGLAFLVFVLPQDVAHGGLSMTEVSIWAIGGAVGAVVCTWILDSEVPHPGKLARPVD